MDTTPAASVNDGPESDLPDLVRADLAHVDLLDDVTLHNCAESALAANNGQYTEAIASRLDSLLAVRLVRLLRSTTATEAHMESLDKLIAGLSRDKFRAALNGLSRPYFSRWSSFRELLSKAIAAVRWEQTQATSTTANRSQTHWEVVARLLLQAGDAGLPWSVLADKVMAMTGRRSRGGVSTLLTSLRAARWVEVLAEPQGQQKRVYPGPKITDSLAWNELKGAAHVGMPSTSERVTAGPSAELVRDIMAMVTSKYTVELLPVVRPEVATAIPSPRVSAPGANVIRPPNWPAREAASTLRCMSLH